MPGHADELGLDPDRLAQRFKFLTIRAQAQDKAALVGQTPDRSDMHRACAATLRRDAASIALLLGKIVEARDMFRDAGEALLQLGLFYGQFLMRLSGQKITGSWFNDWMQRAMVTPHGTDGETSAELPRFAIASAGTPRQLLSLAQAAPEKSGTGSEVRYFVQDRLFSYRTLPLGAAGTPLAQYLKVLNALITGDFDSKAIDSLTGMAIQRRDLIEAARTDEFHWSRVQQPAEMIDFDLLALGFAAATNHGADSPAFGIMAERGSAAALPFRLALELADFSKPSDY